MQPKPLTPEAYWSEVAPHNFWDSAGAAQAADEWLQSLEHSEREAHAHAAASHAAGSADPAREWSAQALMAWGDPGLHEFEQSPASGEQFWTRAPAAQVSGALQAELDAQWAREAESAGQDDGALPAPQEWFDPHWFVAWGEGEAAARDLLEREGTPQAGPVAPEAGTAPETSPAEDEPPAPTPEELAAAAEAARVYAERQALQAERRAWALRPRQVVALALALTHGLRPHQEGDETALEAARHAEAGTAARVRLGEGTREDETCEVWATPAGWIATFDAHEVPLSGPVGGDLQGREDALRQAADRFERYWPRILGGGHRTLPRLPGALRPGDVAGLSPEPGRQWSGELLITPAYPAAALVLRGGQFWRAPQDTEQLAARWLGLGQ